MIVEKTIQVTWHKKNMEHYISKGYIFTKIGDKLEVKKEDVTIGTSTNINIICDSCGKKYSICSGTYLTRKIKNNKTLDLCRECTKIHDTGYGSISLVLNGELISSIKDWKKDSISKCNGKCVITGKPSNIVHHKYGYRKIVLEALSLLKLDVRYSLYDYDDIDIKRIRDKVKELHYKHGLGVCLSKEMHYLYHSEYGTIDVTEEKFQEFYNEQKII